MKEAPQGGTAGQPQEKVAAEPPAVNVGPSGGAGRGERELSPEILFSK